MMAIDTSAGVIMKDILVAMSGLALGIGVVSVFGVWRRGYRRMVKAAWTVFMAGVAMRVGLLLSLIWQIPRVPPSIETWLYLAGLTATCVGGAMLLRYRP